MNTLRGDRRGKCPTDLINDVVWGNESCLESFDPTRLSYPSYKTPRIPLSFYLASRHHKVDQNTANSVHIFVFYLYYHMWVVFVTSVIMKLGFFFFDSFFLSFWYLYLFFYGKKEAFGESSSDPRCKAWSRKRAIGYGNDQHQSKLLWLFFVLKA